MVVGCDTCRQEAGAGVYESECMFLGDGPLGGGAANDGGRAGGIADQREQGPWPVTHGGPVGWYISAVGRTHPAIIHRQRPTKTMAITVSLPPNSSVSAPHCRQLQPAPVARKTEASSDGPSSPRPVSLANGLTSVPGRGKRSSKTPRARSKKTACVWNVGICDHEIASPDIHEMAGPSDEGDVIKSAAKTRSKKKRSKKTKAPKSTPGNQQLDTTASQSSQPIKTVRLTLEV